MLKSPQDLLEAEEQFLDGVQREWLKPSGPLPAALHRLLYAVTWVLIRVFFQVRVEARDRLPAAGPMIFAPNHESSLDAPLLAAALPYRTLRRTYWAGRKGRVLSNALVRLLNRAAQVIPIDRDPSALAAGAAVLKRGNNLVWFPEGTRTRDGELQEFKLGIGALVQHLDATVIPVGIDGAYEAFPPGHWFPRLGAQITVRFGEPLVANRLGAEEEPPAAYRQLADELHERVAKLNSSA